MPAPVDLTGRRFGDLTVLRKVGKRPDMARLNTLWLCRCERCGREETMPQLWIPYRPSLESRRGARWCCSVCFRGPCEVCQGEILTDTYHGVCCEECHTARRQKQGREFHQRRHEEDPDYFKKVYRHKRKVLESDPDKLEAKRAADRARGLRRDRERDNAAARVRYWQRRDEHITRRKAQLAQLSEEERLIKEQQEREYRREYWLKNREAILAKRAEQSLSLTPEQLEHRRARVRVSYQRKRQKEALGDLMARGATLLNKANDDEPNHE